MSQPKWLRRAGFTRVKKTKLAHIPDVYRCDNCGELAEGSKEVKAHECREDAQPSKKGKKEPPKPSAKTQEVREQLKAQSLTFGGGVDPKKLDGRDFARMRALQGEEKNIDVRDLSDAQLRMILDGRGSPVNVQPLVDSLAMMFDGQAEKFIKQERDGPDGDDGPPPMPEKISDEEKQLLAESIEPVLLLHAEVFVKIAPYLNLTVALVSVFGPRLIDFRRRIVYERERKAEQSGYVQAPRAPQEPTETEGHERDVGRRLARRMGGMSG